MATEIVLPRQGNSVESCIILEWKKAEGDPVTTGEPIVEVETDKATFDVESTADGVLLARLVGEGDDVPVLSPIAIVGQSGESVDRSAGHPSAEPSPREVPVHAAHAEPRATMQSGRTTPAISPRARRLAAEHGVDVGTLIGTGPRGRVMVRDVEPLIGGIEHARTEAPNAATPDRSVPTRSTTGPGSSANPTTFPGDDASSAEFEEVPISGIRAVIASRMRESLATTAQFTMNSGADARRLLEFRAHLKTSENPELNTVSVNDLVLFAASRVLRRYPELNATFSGETVRQFRSVNLGFAVDTDRGLMVPVIHGADRLSLAAMSAEAHRLASACRTRSARPEDLAGATFSVTNLGVYGVSSFTPVLDSPQVAILGVCSIELKPTLVDDEVEFVPTIGLSLTIDHQIVDGAPGARFLQSLAEALAHLDITLAQ